MVTSELRFVYLTDRQTEGIINAIGKRLPANPSYAHICKRINRLNIDIKKDKTDDDDDDLIISIDSTGIKVTNRGQWISEKWNKQNKRGYLKIHVAVDIKTKEILALEVTTDEKVHDSKMLKKLVNNILDNQDKKKIKSVLTDGAYDSNTNFKYLQEKKITPAIKVRTNSIVSIRNNRLRNKEVRLQTKEEDQLKWKKKRKYGQRWMSETAFSTIKRMFGEHTSEPPGFKTW